VSAYHRRESIGVPFRGFTALLTQQASDGLKMEAHSGMSVYITQVPEGTLRNFM